jgi:membrane protease YdiL (CAAX protease family)
MMISPALFSILLILVSAGLLAVTGLRKIPGVGILVVGILAGIALWLRGQNLAAIGLSAPPNWPAAILLGLLLGVFIQLLSVTLVEPLAEKITGEVQDLSLLKGIKGSWKALLLWLLLIWTLVAFVEEGIFRGFLMSEIARLLGTGLLGLAVNVLFTSLIFGLAHGYQNRSGIIATGAAGLLLAILFVLSNFNLWLVIFTHGFIDTLGIALIVTGHDQAIRQWIWKQK